MSRVLACTASLLALIGAAAGSAHAAGGPVPYDSSADATALAPTGEGPRYAAVTHGDQTTILQIDQDGGEILGQKTIDGAYGIPVVAMDGTAAGLSSDGSRLVLAESRWVRFQFPRDGSSFVVVDIRPGGRMQPQPPLTLRGDFSFDAFSADGRTLYLTEYASRNLSDYAVREYDLERQRLLREPVLVAHEVSPGEMRGVPVTRTTSPDGRWAYTLYDRGGRRDEVAFIHTLDRERGISHCVDLSMVSGEDAWRVDLELTDGGGTLHATRGNEVVAMLDTETFALSEPLAPEATATGDDGGVPGGVAIGAFIAGVALLAGAALGLRRRRNDTSLPTDPFGTPEPDVEPERGRVST